MSNSPWGPPPPNENPYGQHAGHALPSHGGQSPYAGPGEPYPGAGPYGAPPQDSDRRPGTVTAAAVITWVCAGLSALLFGLTAFALLVAQDAISDEVTRQLRSDPAFDGVEMPAAGELAAIVAIVMAVLAVWALVACALAVLAMRRSNAGRILLVVSAAVSGLLSLLAILSGVTVITLIASIAVIVLLFTGGAGDWYARRSPEQRDLPPGTTQPWA